MKCWACEAPAWLKIARRNINNLRYVNDTTLWEESRKLRSQHPIPSLHGKQMGKERKQWWDFILGGSKINGDCDCSHEIKRCLLLGRKVMANLDSILKSRDITLSTEFCLVKAMIFPVIMYGCESWTIKKAECWRIEAFELWCWRRLLRVPWTARRSKGSILKEISPE